MLERKILAVEPKSRLERSHEALSADIVFKPYLSHT